MNNTMEFTAKAVAEFLKGEILGDPDIKVNNVSKIEEGLPGTLSFLANPKYEEFVYTSEASVIIVNRDFKPAKQTKATLIKVEDAYQAIAALLQLQESMKPEKIGVHGQSWVEESVKFGKDLYIGAFAYIGENAILGNKVKIYPQVFIGDNVEVGDGTIIYPGAKVYHGCKIGKNCIVHSGVVVGSDGFGFAPSSERDYKKIPQIGNVILEDNVEIGSNTTIDRATMGSTIIKKGVKLDNLIQIAHNVVVGENTVIAAQTGISGSTKIGKKCMFGGQVGIIGHIEIADNVKVGAQAGISKDTPEGSILWGSPAFSLSDYRRSYVYFKKLPSITSRIDALEKQIKELKSK